jgi:GxxExxY protein
MSVNAKEDQIGKEVVDSAFQVHKRLGPGLLEKVYETCLAYELESKGLTIVRQKPIPITYGDIEFDEGFRMDLLVEDAVIIELKAVEKSNPLWQAQLLSYLRLSNKKLGYLINFNTILFKQGIQRLVI